MTARCDLCQQPTTAYRLHDHVRVYDGGQLRDLLTCVACDPQLPEATQKQRKRAERAESEVMRLTEAERLLREAHMTTVRERDAKAESADSYRSEMLRLAAACDQMQAERDEARAELARLKAAPLVATGPSKGEVER